MQTRLALYSPYLPLPITVAGVKPGCVNSMHENMVVKTP
jgi:hypothetical protein